jgi:dCTP deaminase
MLRDKHWSAFSDGSTPLSPDDVVVGPNSVDVTLGSVFLSDATSPDGPIDPNDPTCITWEKHTGAICLRSGDFVLGCVRERFVCPGAIPMLEGRSTLARCGLMVHITAGFGDLGFEGAFTLELKNLNRRSILLRPGMRIAQVYFVSPVTLGSAGGAYQGAYSGWNHYAEPVAPVLGKDRF